LENIKAEVENQKLNEVAVVVDNSEALNQSEEIIKDAEEKAEEIIAKSTSEANEKQVEFEKAMGDVSIREKWLSEKEESLKTIKTELEAFHGKKININI
jgi:prephenate dehydratase